MWAAAEQDLMWAAAAAEQDLMWAAAAGGHLRPAN